MCYNDIDANIIRALCRCNVAIIFILNLLIITEYGCCLYMEILLVICCKCRLKICHHPYREPWFTGINIRIFLIFLLLFGIGEKYCCLAAYFWYVLQIHYQCNIHTCWWSFEIIPWIHRISPAFLSFSCTYPISISYSRYFCSILNE